MKFHGVEMTGPFVNQKMVSLPTFLDTRDQGRLVWLTDGTIWYGSDTEWVNFSSGAGDANEVEDMYSDLLRTTIFLNASYNEFALVPDEDTLVDDANTDMTHNAKFKYYSYTSGQKITSTNLYDVESGASFVDYVLVSVDYLAGSLGTIEVTSNGGTTWNTVSNNRVFRIDNTDAGIDLRIRFTGAGNGFLYSWGVLYNKDLTAACTKYGLTYDNFTATEGQSTFFTDYTVGAVQVFLNGDLLDETDYTATNGESITLATPCVVGDIVYILTYSTSTLDLANLPTAVDSWQITSIDTQLSLGDRYFVDTSGGAVTMTMPANPVKDDTIGISDYSGTFETNNCVIARNGDKIMGFDEDLYMDVDWITIKLTYFDTVQGWKIVTISS